MHGRVFSKSALRPALWPRPPDQAPSSYIGWRLAKDDRELTIKFKPDGEAIRWDSAKKGKFEETTLDPTSDCKSGDSPRLRISFNLPGREWEFPILGWQFG